MLDENKEYVELIAVQEEPVTLKDRFANLLSIKSLVTLLFTLTFVYLAIIRVMSGEDVKSIYILIISFYFGTQAVKE